MSPVSDFVAGGIGPSAFFGDGSDGGIVITGTTTETQNRYWNTLLVDTTGTYVGANWLIHARISAIVNGLMHNDGGAGATAGTAGAVTPSGYLNGSLGAGGAGGTAAGSAAGNLGQCLGGSGGAGGSGSSGAGGAGGVAIDPTPLEGGVPRTLALLQGMLFGKGGVVAWRAGCGGGGGGGDLTSGAGGGSSGGHLWLAASNLIIGPAGILRAAGGAGGAAVAGNRGGGGGGGGGFLATLANKYQLDPKAIISVPGGAAGAGFGTGTAGVAGVAGKIVMLNRSLEG